MHVFRCTVLALTPVICWAALSLGAGPARLRGALAGPDGRPLAGAMLYIFDAAGGPPPAIERYWRIPDQKIQLDEGGRFDLALDPGTYHLAAILHADPALSGPPRGGELIFVSRTPEGEPLGYSLREGEDRPLGTLRGYPYDPRTSTGRAGITAIEGRVVGEDGTPITGAAVLAFTTSRPVGRPLFTSEPTDGEGRFLLRVHQGGTYYLKVRGKHGGGRPGRDSVLDGERDEKLLEVTVTTGGTVKGVIHKALTLRGPESKRRRAEMIEAGLVPGAEAPAGEAADGP